MSDVAVMRIEEFDSPNGGGFCRARASLGVTSFGMQVENFPPHFEHFPEHGQAHPYPEHGPAYHELVWLPPLQQHREQDHQPRPRQAKQNTDPA